MRILYHHRTLGDGAEGIHIREMIAAFRAQGHEVRVVALVDEQISGVQSRPSGWCSLSRFVPSGAYEFAELAYNLVARRAVARAIRKFQPDLVYDRYNTYSSAAVQAARAAGIPCLLEVNAPAAWERENYENRRLTFPGLARMFERRICNAADHVFVVSTPLKEFLVAERNVPESKVTVLPNGANPDLFDPTIDGGEVRRRFGIGDRSVIGFVGILRPWHGIELLLAAFAELVRQGSDVHLLLVGDGPMQSSLEAKVGELSLQDRVTFTGRVPHSSVNQHVAAMDIAVSPRATFYASPMKILEYMAMGRATVAPRMPNIEDILIDGSDAILFQPESTASLVEALKTLVRNQPLSRELGFAARRRIVDRYNWGWNANRILEVTQRLGCRASEDQPQCAPCAS